MNRIADEEGIVRRTSEPMERNPYGLWIRLVSGRGVAADDRIDESGEPDMSEPAMCPSLRGQPTWNGRNA